MTRDSVAVTFIELVRRGGVKIRKWCDACQKDTDWRLVRETATTETYRFPGCGWELEYRVR